MIQRFKRSWEIFNLSFDVLMRNKKLLVFPMVTMVCTVFIFIFFFGAIVFQPTGHSYTDKAHWNTVMSSMFEDGTNLEDSSSSEKGMWIVAIAYFLSMFLATFFNVAFFHEIFDAIQGNRVSVREGLQFAMSRLPQILMWSLFAGLIGYLIRALEERLPLFGKIMVGIIGMLWSVASIFAIPVMIMNQNVTSPMAILKSSAQTLKKSWGESLAGFTGLSVLMAIPIFMIVPISALSAFFVSQGMSPFVVSGVLMLWILLAIPFMYVVGVAGNIFKCSLYLYATTGNLPGGFTQDQMNSVWKFKK